MSVFSRLRGFEGGRFFPPPAVDTARRATCPLAAPRTLRVPLLARDGTVAEPVIATGHAVTANEPLARSPDGCFCVHAPAPGLFRRIVSVETPSVSRVPAMEFGDVPEAYTDPLVAPSPESEAEQTSPAGMITLLRECGLLVPHGDRIARAGKVGCIIVSALDHDPHQSAFLRTLIDAAEAIVVTASRLHKLFSARRTYIILDDARHGLVAELAEAAHGYPPRVRGIPNKYPQWHEKLLVSTVTKREIPSGCNSLDLGVWVLDVCDVLNMHRALVGRRPPNWQTVTVSGDAIARPGNYRIPIGANVGDVLNAVGIEHTPQHVVSGGMLNGFAVRDLDVVLPWGMRCLTAWRRPAPERRPPTACIRCGGCQEICPVGLDPRAILDCFDREYLDEAARLHPEACIACGLCDYVCPSALPLMRAAREWQEGGTGD